MIARKHFTSEQMLDAAFQFRKAELWSYLDDSNVFAVELPSGDTGYCIAIGSAGSYFGLGLYRGGKEGFGTYIRMINPPNNSLDALEQFLTYDAIY